MEQPERAFVLHRWPYRDTSYLVDFFTQSQGRVRGVLRGARQANSKRGSSLQLFQPLQILWRGKGDLVTITQLEMQGPGYFLSGNALIMGLYLNELLVRVLHARDPYVQVFEQYTQTLALLNGKNAASALRLFEKTLLNELGYGIDFDRDAETGRAINPHQKYMLVYEQGLVPCAHELSEKGLLGAHILAFSRNELTDLAVLNTAKRLMQQLLKPLLQGKPLMSRQLWLTERKVKNDNT